MLSNTKYQDLVLRENLKHFTLMTEGWKGFYLKYIQFNARFVMAIK